MKHIYLRYPGGRTKALTFSFDDGVGEDRRLIGLFKKYGVKGTFNLVPEFFGDTCKNPPYQYWMSRGEVESTYKDSGMEVASHGISHADLKRLNDAEVLADIIDCRRELERLFGTVVTGFAYPFGGVNANIEDLLRHAGYEYGRTAPMDGTMGFGCFPESWYRWTPTVHQLRPELESLADRFVASAPTSDPWNIWGSDPLLFYIWGHAYEFDSEERWARMESLLQKVSGRDEVWYATNIEICRYTKAFESIEYSIGRDRAYNGSSMPVWILHDEKTVCLEPGKVTEI